MNKPQLFVILHPSIESRRRTATTPATTLLSGDAPRSDTERTSDLLTEEVLSTSKSPMPLPDGDKHIPSRIPASIQPAARRISTSCLRDQPRPNRNPLSDDAMSSEPRTREILCAFGSLSTGPECGGAVPKHEAFLSYKARDVIRRSGMFHICSKFLIKSHKIQRVTHYASECCIVRRTSGIRLVATPRFYLRRAVEPIEMA